MYGDAGSFLIPCCHTCFHPVKGTDFASGLCSIVERIGRAIVHAAARPERRFKATWKRMKTTTNKFTLNMINLAPYYLRLHLSRYSVGDWPRILRNVRLK